MRSVSVIWIVGLLLLGCRTTVPAPSSPPDSWEPEASEPAAEPAPGPAQGPVQAPEPVKEGGFLPPLGAPDGGPDWIRLVSGEMLRGEITVLRTGTLQFDSDELDDQSFDFEDVPEVYTTRPMMCVIEKDTLITGRIELLSRREQTVLIGPIHITPERVHVRTEAERKSFPRSALLTLIPGRPSEASYWSGQLGFGLDWRSGNVDQEDVNFDVSFTRRTPYSRLDASFSAAVTTVDSEDTSNNSRGNLKYDYFVSRRLYLTPFWLQYFRDPFQNISARWAPGAGAGYYIFDQSGLEWNVDLGAGYQYTRLDSVEPGEDSTDTTAFARFGSQYAADITSKTDVTITYSILQPFDGSGNYNQHFDIVVSTDLWWNFDLDVAFYWDRQGEPLEDSGGVVPEKDDFRTTVGIAWDF